MRRSAVRAEETRVEARPPAAIAEEQPLRRRSGISERRAGPGRLRRLVGLVLLVPAIGLVLVLALGLVYSAVTPPSTLMLGRWLTLQPVAREAVPLSGISPNLVQAVLTSEDQRFCLHHGVDLGALRDVVEDEDGPSRGASTIAMQTVKNVFLWPGRSYIRKALEIPLAAAFDALWGKRRMLEIYLNVAEWGDGIYGAQAASRHWFGKDARNLTRQEAALLAAALPNPIQRSAGKPSRSVRAIAARIQARMGQVEGLMGCVRG
ncbi:monofunctional biosynthetic peptidoglycan transglycosylase [Methylobacterium gregans]|uniref:Biosynthetic peptidoglycan transglycosylase n=1 Tax=Methylobacterium gregans TaxID=374424 RepID=A0AA37HK21_9HYPH|nr:monofunctional biosynthetic peptidoglycan transglycosylase [Methylobacterium gregans]MDQ0522845.1 monofunctional biosynthetic peptidoglycan transglycosylase [Methylobacterium gregans]GJD77142.1 Biosynthetic peptidoglycan transglycosylase [Methylobacterium gregans]